MVVRMLILLLLSVVMAEEIGLNMTGSGTAQSQLTSSTSSEPQTVSFFIETLPPSTIIIDLSSVSSTSSSPSSTQTVTETLAPSTVIIDISSVSKTISSDSTTITPPASLPDGPIYTSIECDVGQGRNCLRSPELPYWYGVTPGNSVYGFTPLGMRDPWRYGYSFVDYNVTSGALESAMSCGSIFSSSLNSWLATAPLSTGAVLTQSTATRTLEYESYVETRDSAYKTGTKVETETDTFSGHTTTYTQTFSSAFFYSDYTTTFVQQATTETLIYASATPYFYASQYVPTFTSPCCSSCSILGGSVEVMYWPPATATGKANNATMTAPSTVVQSGFTFTSPSIYMAIQTLEASDLCGPVGSIITERTTLSFAPEELTTAIAYSRFGTLVVYPSWEPQFTDFAPATFGTAPCTYVTTEAFGIRSVSYNPCYPYISIPPQLRAADPLWSTCVSVFSIVLYDPPYVISSAARGLDPFTTATSTPTAEPITSSGPVLSTTEPASPGSTTSPLSGPTSTAILTPTSAPIDPADPSSTPSLGGSNPQKPVDPSSAAPLDPSPTDSKPQDPARPSQGNPSDPSPSDSSPQDPGNASDSSPTATPVAPVDPAPSTTPIAVGPGTFTSSAEGVIIEPSGQTVPAMVVTFGSSIITADSSSNFVIGTQTLAPGGKVTISGTTVSLATNGATIAIGGVRQNIATATDASAILIGSQTLSAGGAPITISGTALSLMSGGSSVVVGGSTQAISAMATYSGLSGEIVAIGGTTQTIANAVPTLFVGTQALSAGGPPVVVSGTAYSLEPGGWSVVVGGSTQAISALASETGLGGVIASIGGFGSSTSDANGPFATEWSPSNGTAYIGSAMKADLRSLWFWGCLFGAGMLAVWGL